MPQLLATFTDGNAWLDEDKIKFKDNGDALPEATNASARVRGALWASFSNLGAVAIWDAISSPPETDPPDIVRQVTAMYMASFRYAKKYSEESVEKNGYAVYLVTAADLLLQQILDGTIRIDASTEPGIELNANDFWPNDSTGLLCPSDQFGGGEDIKFTMNHGINRSSDSDWP